MLLYAYTKRIVWADHQHQESQHHGWGSPCTTINQHRQRSASVEVTDYFTYLGSTITSNLSLASVLLKLIAWQPHWARECGTTTSWLWILNSRCTRSVSSAPGYVAVNPVRYIPGMRTAWKTYTFAAYDESWGKVTKATLLEPAGSLSMHLLLWQHRLRWLGHVYGTKDGRTPKDNYHVRRANHRTPSTTLSGCQQVGPGSRRHRPRQLRAACRWPQWLTPCCSRRSQEARGKAQPNAGGQKTQEAETENWSFRSTFQMSVICKERIDEPLQTLFLTRLILTDQDTTIISQDRQMHAYCYWTNV